MGGWSARDTRYIADEGVNRGGEFGAVLDGRSSGERTP